MPIMIAIAQLKAAYRASGLALQGKTFGETVSSPLLRRMLEAHAAAVLKNMQRRGQMTPVQQELAL